MQRGSRGGQSNAAEGGPLDCPLIMCDWFHLGEVEVARERERERLILINEEEKYRTAFLMEKDGSGKKWMEKWVKGVMSENKARCLSKSVLKKNQYRHTHVTFKIVSPLSFP